MRLEQRFDAFCQISKSVPINQKSKANSYKKKESRKSNVDQKS